MANLSVSPSGCSACRNTSDLGFEFTMAFQPIVERSTGAVFAQEALVRGLDGSGAGSVFEHVNSENLYHFDQTCRTTAIRLAAELGLDELLSINFMPNAVYEPERCLQTTLEVADETGMPLSQLIFEIVETEHVADPEHVANIIDVYRAFGMKTAIDDIGAGHASMMRMINFSTDVHKVDRALITGIDTDPRRQAVLKGLVQISHDLGARLVAEGIETRGELITVLSMGVELVQGFFIARPQFRGVAQISDEASEILQSHSAVRA